MFKKEQHIINITWLKPLQLGFSLFLLVTGFANAQSKLDRSDIDKALLQIHSGFYTVIRNARVDLDSSLFIGSKRYKKSRAPIITEHIDDEYAKHCGWMDKGNVDSVQQLVTRLQGSDHARLLLFMGAYYVFHPGFESKYTGLAITHLLAAKKESDRLHLTNFSFQSACLLGKAYFKQNNIAEGKKWFATITDSKNITDKQLVAKAWDYEGMYCPFIPATTNFRIDCLNKALALFVQLNDTGNQMNTLMNIAYLSYAGGNLKNASVAAKRSLLLQQVVQFPYQQYTNDLCSFIAGLGSDYAKQLKYSLAADNDAETNKDTLELAHFYYNTANVYKSEKSDYEFEAWQQKSLAAFKKYGGDFELWRLFIGMSDNSFEKMSGSELLSLIKATWQKYPPTDAVDKQCVYMAMALCYKKEHDYITAQKYFLLAKGLEKQNTLSTGGVENVLLNYQIGRNYFNINKIDSSKKYLLKVLSSPTTPESLIMHAYFGMYEVDSSFNNYKSAMLYLNKYTRLLDKFSNEVESKQIYDLTIKYHTLQKEKNLQELKTQNALQKQQDASTRKLFLVGIILLLCVIIMIYSRYYFNKRSNTKLQAQKEEIDVQNVALHDLNQKQQLLIGEKELLLREIHHRVKNNLQTTMSLLNMQSAHIDNAVALETIRNSQRRMHAMSLIHQKLYESEKLTSINMANYIRELTSYLQESFITGNIYFELELQPLELDIAQAIPIGLIINEAVTNAIKYAFPENKKGIITIILRKTPDGHCQLTVKDNGIGIRVTKEKTQKSSLGLNLMRGLADQIQGTFEIIQNAGTQIVITFGESELVQVS